VNLKEMVNHNYFYRKQKLDLGSTIKGNERRLQKTLIGPPYWNTGRRGQGFPERTKRKNPRIEVMATRAIETALNRSKRGKEHSTQKAFS